MKPEALEKMIANDKWYFFSILALLSTIGIYINSIIISSFFVGTLFSSIYFAINSIFLGQLFFKDENTNFRVALGLLLLFTLLAFTSGLAMFIVALEIFQILFKMEMVVVVLSIMTITISLTYHIQVKIVKKSAQ